VFPEHRFAYSISRCGLGFRRRRLGLAKIDPVSMNFPALFALFLSSRIDSKIARMWASAESR